MKTPIENNVNIPNPLGDQRNGGGNDERGQTKGFGKLSIKKTRLGKKRLKDYGKVLLAKQLLRALYNNPSEKVFKRYFLDQSSSDPVSLLNSRLEVVLTAMGGAMSLNHARQLINHGKISVNGHVVKKRGYLLRDGDIIASAMLSGSPKGYKPGPSLKTSIGRFESTKIASIKAKKLPAYLTRKGLLAFPKSVNGATESLAAQLIVNTDPSSGLSFGIYYTDQRSQQPAGKRGSSDERSGGQGVSPRPPLGWKNTNVKTIKNLLLPSGGTSQLNSSFSEGRQKRFDPRSGFIEQSEPPQVLLSKLTKAYYSRVY